MRCFWSPFREYDTLGDLMSCRVQCLIAQWWGGTPKPDGAFSFTAFERSAKSRQMCFNRLWEGTSLCCTSFFPLLAAAEGTAVCAHGEKDGFKGWKFQNKIVMKPLSLFATGQNKGLSFQTKKWPYIRFWCDYFEHCMRTVLHWWECICKNTATFLESSS